MAINYQIPQQSRYISTSTIFTADFNVPSPGYYDFNVANNQGIKVEPLNMGTVYLIERISIGGTLSEADYLASIIDFPLLSIKRSVSNEIVYKRPFPIVNYADGIEAAAWIHSDKSNDFLSLSFSGILTQLPSMVGLSQVKIQVSLCIYAIDSQYYNASYRDVQNITIGQGNRR